MHEVDGMGKKRNSKTRRGDGRTEDIGEFGIGGGCNAAPPILMSLINWNYRGFGNSRTVRDLCQIVKKKSSPISYSLCKPLVIKEDGMVENKDGL